MGGEIGGRGSWHMNGGYGFRLEYIGDWERVGWDLGIWRSGL